MGTASVHEILNAEILSIFCPKQAIAGEFEKANPRACFCLTPCPKRRGHAPQVSHVCHATIYHLYPIQPSRSLARLLPHKYPQTSFSPTRLVSSRREWEGEGLMRSSSIDAKMLRKPWVASLLPYLLLLLFLLLEEASSINAATLKLDDAPDNDRLITEEKRRTLTVTDYGQISAVDFSDGYRGPYQLQFITLEPNSLFLPVLLQTDMVFYVHTGTYVVAHL